MEKNRIVFTDGWKFSLTDEDVLESEFFGPTVGKELTKNALTSLLLAASWSVSASFHPGSLLAGENGPCAV